jgi:glycosyltransferase involved in cell wall biosynthesis
MTAAYTNDGVEQSEYDFVFVSHLPSFYKINLFNEIARSIRILVIFLGETSFERTADFVKGEKHFEYLYLNSGDFEQRPLWVSSLKLFRILLRLNYKLISVGAWNLPESWLTILCSPKHKNVIAQETSIFESELTGWKVILKRLFVKRLGLALVSGEPHSRLMRAVGFDGQIEITGGVGLANRPETRQQQPGKFNGRFLYAGRLSPEKNLPFVLRVFALPEMARFHLTIAGDGPARTALQAMASSNVSFIGHVPNEKIPEIYVSHDVLILPSISEPWGLVVEEALYYGLPVLASSQVGSVEDLILNCGAGLSFDPHSETSLRGAIESVSEQYEQFSIAAHAIDFDMRDKAQVAVYIEAVNSGSAK